MGIGILHASSIPTITASNTITDLGQYITFTATAPAGSTGPYTYNFSVYNISVDGLEVNALYTGVSSSTNTFTVDISDSVLPLSSQRNYQFGGLEANVIVTDASNTVTNSTYVHVVRHDVPQVSAASVSNTVLDSGQTYTITLSNIAGGAGKFNTQLYNITSSSAFGSNVLVPSIGSNTLSFTAYSTTTSNVFLFGVNSYDEGTTTPYIFGTSYPYTNYNVPGYQPGVAVSPNGDQVYMTEAAGAYNIFDASLEYYNYINSALPMHYSRGVAFSPDGSLAYITDYTGDNVLVVNTASNTVVNTIAVQSEPLGVAFDPTKGFAYVTNFGSNTLSIINVSSNTVVGTLYMTAGANPANVSFSPNGTYAYVVNEGNSTISKLSATTSPQIVNDIAVGCNPSDIAINPAGTLAYVTSGFCATVGINVINLNNDTIVNSIVPGGKPSSVAFGPSGLLAYAGNTQSGGGLQVINVPGNSLAYTITGSPSLSGGGSPISGVAVSPNKGLAYTSDCINGYACSIEIPLAIMVNPALTAPSISSSASTIDQGQSATLSSSWSGGTLPYTVTWYTGPSGNSCSQDSANVLASYSSFTGTSNSITVSVATTNSYCIGVTDSATTPSTGLSTNTVVTVNIPLTAPTLSPSNPTITNGQSVTFTASWTGGTPTYGASLYSSSTSTCNQSSTLVEQQVGLSTNFTTFSAVSPTSITYYCVLVTDNSTSSYSITNIIPHSGFSDPQGVAISPDGSFAYVTNYYGNDVKVIDTATNAIVSTISSTFFVNGSFVSHPGYVAFAPSGAYAYVSSHSANVVIVNTSTNTVTGYMPNGFSSPIGIVFYPSGAYAYIANTGSSNVVIVNTSTNTVTGDISAGISSPRGLALSPNAKYLYVVNSGNIIIINTATNTVTGAITAGVGNPYGIAISPSGTYAYLANEGVPGNVVIIDTATNTVTSAITSYISNPRGIAFSPDGTYAYVANLDSTDTSPAQNVTAINSGPETKTSTSTKVTINAQTGSVSNPYRGGPTGFHGTQPGATTSATTSTTSTASTTSIRSSVPVTIPVIRPTGATTHQLCNDTMGYYVVYPSLDAAFHIKPGIASCINMTAANVTPEYQKTNSSIINAINYSTSNNTTSTNVTINYPCGTDYSNIYPAILSNNTWQKITPFTINASACTVTFAIPSDPVIAIFNTNSTASNSTTVSTTSVNTTVPQPTNSSNSSSNKQNQDIIWAVLTIIVVIIILFVYSRSRKR